MAGTRGRVGRAIAPPQVLNFHLFRLPLLTCTYSFLSKQVQIRERNIRISGRVFWGWKREEKRRKRERDRWREEGRKGGGVSLGGIHNVLLD